MLSRSFLKNRIEAIRQKVDGIKELIVRNGSKDALMVDELAALDKEIKSLRYEVVNDQLMLGATVAPRGYVDSFLDEHDNPCHCCHCEDRRRRRDGEYRRNAAMMAQV